MAAAIRQTALDHAVSPVVDRATSSTTKASRSAHERDGMKRSVLLGFAAVAIAGVVACSTSGGTPGPGVPRRATATAPPSPSPVTAGTAATANAGALAAATAYYQAVAAQRYQQAYTYLDAAATGPGGQPLTWTAFRDLASTIDTQEGTVTDFSVDASGSMVVLTIGRPAVGRYHAHLTVRQEGADWKITAIDRI